MKKILFSIIAFIALTGLLLSGCEGFRFIRGSGEIVTKEYDFKDFSAVEASFAFSVDISRSESFSVVVSTRENIIEYLDVAISGDTLRLRLKPGNYTNTDLNAVVTMPEINKLKLSGASRGNIGGFKSADDFELELSGATQLELDMETGHTSAEISGASRATGQLTARDIRLEISGASRAELSGSASDFELDVSGASQASLVNFTVANADLNVSGASRASVTTDGALKVDVSGASSVDYYGNPTLTDISVTGASRLNKK